MSHSSHDPLSPRDQISDITSFLPSSQRIALENAQEVLECLVIRRSEDTQFLRSSAKCESEPSVVSARLLEQFIVQLTLH